MGNLKSTLSAAVICLRDFEQSPLTILLDEDDGGDIQISLRPMTIWVVNVLTYDMMGGLEVQPPTSSIKQEKGLI